MARTKFTGGQNENGKPNPNAMASVKWLTRIYAVREPFQGYGQTSDYGYWDYVDGKPRNE
jgi:hypothetical protein